MKFTFRFATPGTQCRHIFVMWLWYRGNFAQFLHRLHTRLFLSRNGWAEYYECKNNISLSRKKHHKFLRLLIWTHLEDWGWGGVAWRNRNLPNPTRRFWNFVDLHYISISYLWEKNGENCVETTNFRTPFLRKFWTSWIRPCLHAIVLRWNWMHVNIPLMFMLSLNGTGQIAQSNSVFLKKRLIGDIITDLNQLFSLHL